LQRLIERINLPTVVRGRGIELGTTTLPPDFANQAVVAAASYRPQFLPGKLLKVWYCCRAANQPKHPPG
jgi:hypothetical protein